MIAIKYCPDCGQLLPDPPFYCNWCGSCLNKMCIKCELLGFSKFCTQCGSEMVRPNVKSKPQTQAATDKRIITSTIEPSKSSKPQSLSTGDEITIKVKILKGIDMKEIPLHSGGGCRHIPMSKSDSLDEVKSKIIDHYFCSTDSREKYSTLGSPHNYLAVMLDFKRDDLTANTIESLGKYLKHHGIKPNSGPSFYLHLLDKPKFQSTNLVELNNKSQSQNNVYKNQHQLTNTIQTSHSSFVHSFNKKQTSTNELNEIHNTFLLKPTNSKQNHVSESIKSISSLREINSKLNQSTQNSNKSTISTTIPSNVKKKPLLNTPNTKSSSDSSSSSDSDSGSDSSTSTTVVNKKTIKRTHDEIKKMKSVTSSPQKKTKIDIKQAEITNISTTKTTIKVKNEPVENEANNKTNVKKENSDALCLTSNSPIENTLNLHVDQNEFNEDSSKNKNYNFKDYDSTYRRYNNYNNDYYHNRYSNDNSRNYSRYPNTRYSPSNYNSNNRYFNSRYNYNRTDRSNQY